MGWSIENHLPQMRQRIDAIDDQLLRLLTERARLAQQVGKLKQGNLYRPEREAQVLNRLANANVGPLPTAAVRLIFREVMSACLALEQPLKVAYFGPPGTFTEAAAKTHFGSAPQYAAQPTIDEVFRAVENDHADYGVAPVENSTEGAVGRTLDLLLSSPLMICGEVSLRIHQNLLRSDGAADELETIQRVYSHPQSLAQCHEWLNRYLPQAERLPTASNAEAARLAAQTTEPGIAAIAGEAAAQRYGLKIVAANIEDDANNSTRFIVIGRHDAGPSGRDKTSLVCSTRNIPGAMHDLLAPLAAHGVSMAKLESRPARGGSPWEYVFFIDIEGHRLDAAPAAALRDLKACAGFIKELGSYPQALA